MTDVMPTCVPAQAALSDLRKLLTDADKEIACLNQKVQEQHMTLLASEQQHQLVMQRLQEAANQLDAGQSATVSLQ